MAKSTAAGPLVSIYESRIGGATNSNEVMGYWLFLTGVILGFIGLVLYYLTPPATMFRGVGYALAALAPALLMAGAVLRFPLRKMATGLVGVGVALTIAAIAWFVWVFPAGWSLTTGNSAVIMTYVVGLAIIGIAGSVIPLATDARDTALSTAVRRAETAETAGANAAAAARASERAGKEREDNLAAAGRESERAGKEREENLAAAGRESERAGKEREERLAAEIVELAAEIKGLEGDNSDLRSSKAEFELYTDDDDKWRWRLVHDNGNIIADSGESYSSKSMAKKGLGSVKLNALGAEIDEL